MATFASLAAVLLCLATPADASDPDASDPDVRRSVLSVHPGRFTVSGGFAYASVTWE